MIQTLWNKTAYELGGWLEDTYECMKVPIDGPAFIDDVFYTDKTITFHWSEQYSRVVRYSKAMSLLEEIIIHTGLQIKSQLLDIDINNGDELFIVHPPLVFDIASLRENNANKRAGFNGTLYILIKDEAHETTH